MIALCLLFAVSLTTLALGDNYDMSSDLRRLGDEEGRTSNAVRAELLLPSDYLSAGFVEDEGIYYFELQKELDSSEIIDFAFWFKGISCTPTEAQSKTNFMPYFKVYQDSSLSTDSLVASYENEKLIWDSQDKDGIDVSTPDLAAQHNNESILRFHIAAGTLEPGSSYYLVMENSFPNPRLPAAMRLPGNGVYQFKTKKVATGKETSDGSITTSSGASFTVTPSFLSKGGEKTTAQLFINHDSGRYEVDGEVPFQGNLELNVTMTPQNNKKASHLKAYVIDPDKPEVKLQEFNIADDTETKIENEVLSINTADLETGKTYWFVMDKTSQSGTVSFGEDVVFEFSTHSHTRMIQYGIAPTCEGVGYTNQEVCTVCGTVLKEREEIPALGHDWIDMPATDATCTTPGMLPYQQCSRCRSSINHFTDNTKPPLGHIPVVTKEGTVTCTEAGLCEEIVCSRCNQNLQLQKEVEALGHDYVDGVCTRCGEEVTLEDYAAWQGGTISIFWTDPSADDLKTKGLLTDTEGTSYYYNEVSEPFCAETAKRFAFDVKGGGAAHIGKEGNESPANHIFVYSDASLSEESMVASAAKGTITEVARAEKAVTEEGMSNITFAIPSGTLENGKTYYIVIDEALESNQGRTIGTKVVTKVTTSHGDLEEIPAFNPTCTEAGHEAGTMCKECKTYVEGGKEIPATGHTEEVVKGKAATCTENGLTDGKKCSVCGEVLEAQKEIPAKGHTEEVIKGKAATCTEKGLTDGKKCSVCGEVLEAQKDIPALGHDYKDGKCTVCGAEDPNYKPEEPDEPTPVEPDTKFTGLANEADKDGVWWYYTDGKIDKTHTGVDQNKYGWWRVENGKVNFKAQGIYKNAYGWWKTTDGKVTFKENSIYKNEYGWWKCKDSKVDFNAQSIYQNQYGWWKTTGGKVTFKENGVFKNEYGWWKVEKSKVNFKFTGIAKNDYGTWYVKNGKVDFSKNGTVTYAGKAYTVTNGKAKLA